MTRPSFIVLDSILSKKLWFTVSKNLTRSIQHICSLRLYNSTLGAMLHAHYVGAKPKTAWAELAFVDRR